MKYRTIVFLLTLSLLSFAVTSTDAQTATFPSVQALPPEQIPQVSLQARGSDAADAFASLQGSGIYVVPLGTLASHSFLVPVEMRFRSVPARALIEAVAKLHGVQVAWWKAGVTVAVLQHGAPKDQVMRVLADLASASAATRAEAAWRAGWTEDASVVPALAAASGDPDPVVSFQAARSLKRLGWPAVVLLSPQPARDLLGRVTDVKYAFSGLAWSTIAVTYQGKALDLFKKAVDQGASDALQALAVIPGEDAAALLSNARSASRDIYFRRQAVAALGVKSDEPAYSALNDALRDPTVSDVALATLALVWKERALPTVQDALQGKNRAAAIAALGEMGGDRALGLCAALLADPSVAVRQAAARAIGEIGGQGALVPLKNALSDPAVEVWREAVLGLAEVGGTDAVDLILGAANAPREPGGTAAQALGVVGGDRAREKLAALLVDPAQSAAAADALARIGDDASLTALAKGLLGTPPASRPALVRAIGAAGGAGALPLLAKAAADASPEVARALIEAASMLGSVDVLDAIRSHGDAAARRLVAASLGAIGGPAALGVLGSMLADSDPSVRASAVDGVAGTLLPQGAALLQKAITDADPGVQARALEGLGRVGGGDAIAFVEKLMDSDPLAAIAALQHFDSSQTARLWARALADPIPPVWNAALAAVKDLGVEKGGTVLRFMAASDFPETRIAAATFLPQVIGYAAFKDLASLVKDPDARVRQQAVRSLAPMPTNEAVELFGGLLVDTNEEMRRFAVQALINANDSTQLERLLRKASALDNPTLVDAVKKYGIPSWSLVVGRINNATPEAMKAAVEAGSLARVQDLVTKGADPGLPAYDGLTPFVRAAAGGAFDIMDFLFAQAAPGDKPKMLADALQRAGTAGKTDVIEYLLNKGGVPAGALDSADAMVRAAAAGRLDIVMALVKMGWRIDAPDASATTPLAAASESGRVEIVRYLISKGAHVNAKDAAYRTPLMRAAEGAQVAIIKILIQAGANLDAVDRDGRKAADFARYSSEANALLSGVSTDLVDAVKNGDLATVRKIARKDNVNVREDGRDELSDQGPYGRTPLIIAAQMGSFDIAKVLVERGARIGDTHTYSPESDAEWSADAFEVAVVNGHTDIASYLLDNGAKATDDLLLNACMNGHLDIVKLMAEHGASVNVSRPENGWQGPDSAEWASWAGDAISAAIQSGQMDIVDYLILKGAKPSAFDVAAAIGAGKVPLAKSYLSRGAGVSARVLVAAAGSGDADLVAEVIRRGADVNAIGPSGLTPLTAAAQAGSLAAVRLLLSKGADPGMKDGYGRTALERAQDKNERAYYDIQNLLEQIGPDLKSYEIRKQLSDAVAKRDATTVKKLLEQKADPNTEYTSLEEAGSISARLIDLACVMGSKDIVQLFVQYGASEDFTSPGLEYAAYAGKTDLLEILFKAKEVEKGNLQGRLTTVLGIAAERGDTALLDYALKKGASPDGGMTPALISAAGKGFTKIAETLLAKGANVDMKTNWSSATPLSAAMQNDQKDMIDLLLSHGAKGLGDTGHAGPLAYAVRTGKLSWVQSLLDNGTDPNAHLQVETPILVTAATSPLEIVQLLVSKGARLEDKDWNGTTALARAASVPGNEAVTTYLLRQGAAVEPRISGTAVGAQTPKGVTPIDTFMGFGTWNDEIASLLDKAYTGKKLEELFFIALMKRDLKNADSLVAQGAVVDTRAANDRSALMSFAARGDQEVISFLIAHGADPSLEERNYKQNAAEIAAAAGTSDAAKALLALLPDSQAMKERVLRQAARGGRVDLVQLLLAQGASPDAADASGHAPLYFAAAAGSADVVALLLDKGVDVNRRDQYGFSALYAASGQGSKDVIQMLISHGAKLGDGWSTAVAAAVYAHRLDIASLLMDKATPAERKAGGLVALYLAADAGDVAMVKLLLGYGVPPSYVDTAGDTPLTRALGDRGRAGHPEAAKLLVEAGAPLDNGRIPPLLQACEQGYADVVKAMIAKGVNVNVTDDNGSSAITLAARSGSVQTFLALLPKAKTGLTPPELAYFVWPEK